MKVELQRRKLRFRKPLLTAYGELTEREIVQLRLTGPEGVSGRGEAAPLEPYDGVPVEIVLDALEAYRPVLAAGGRAQGAELLDACREIADLPQALAAVDIALWDRAGRREARSVAEMLTDHPSQLVEVNASIGALDRASAATMASVAVGDGFTCLKVKVGSGDDAGRVAAVRAAAGPLTLLRLDANGAWTVEQAVGMIETLGRAGIELIEEPVHGIDALRAVRERVAVRIAMDETASLSGALASGAADAVCLKVSTCGGISGTIAAAALVRTTGAEPYISSTYDGPIGIAAGLHIAAALAPLPPCGLATLGLFADGVEALPVRDGRMAVPAGPGLGL